MIFKIEIVLKCGFSVNISNWAKSHDINGHYIRRSHIRVLFQYIGEGGGVFEYFEEEVWNSNNLYVLYRFELLVTHLFVFVAASFGYSGASTSSTCLTCTTGTYGSSNGE
jgi:hypothetical protein